MGDNSLKGQSNDCNDSCNLLRGSCSRTSPTKGVETSCVGASNNAGGVDEMSPMDRGTLSLLAVTSGTVPPSAAIITFL